MEVVYVVTYTSVDEITIWSVTHTVRALAKWYHTLRSGEHTLIDT